MSAAVPTGASPLRFTAPLYTADVGRVERMRPIRVVIRSFAFGLTGPHDPEHIIVPAGFCSDGASVPRLFWGVISNWGKYAQAAIVHDLIYATGLLDRAAADRIFREAIQVLGRDTETDLPTARGQVSSFIGYWAVQLGGAGGYRNGEANYAAMAGRALKRAEKRDPSLAQLIVTDCNDLVAAQSLPASAIERLNSRQ